MAALRGGLTCPSFGPCMVTFDEILKESFRNNLAFTQDFFPKAASEGTALALVWQPLFEYCKKIENVTYVTQ